MKQIYKQLFVLLLCGWCVFVKAPAASVDVMCKLILLGARIKQQFDVGYYKTIEGFPVRIDGKIGYADCKVLVFAAPTYKELCAICGCLASWITQEASFDFSELLAADTVDVCVLRERAAKEQEQVCQLFVFELANNDERCIALAAIFTTVLDAQTLSKTIERYGTTIVGNDVDKFEIPVGCHDAAILLQGVCRILEAMFASLWCNYEGYSFETLSVVVWQELVARQEFLQHLYSIFGVESMADLVKKFSDYQSRNLCSACVRCKELLLACLGDKFERNGSPRALKSFMASKSALCQRCFHDKSAVEDLRLLSSVLADFDAFLD